MLLALIARGRPSARACGLIWGALGLAAPLALGGDDRGVRAFLGGSGTTPPGIPVLVPPPPPVPPPPKGVKPVRGTGMIGNRESGAGILSYGPPTPVPGYQGFSLRYHLGYGYGLNGLGTTANGGYPYYGGPGYPHPWPILQRLGPIAPFAYEGGPGGPTATCPNYYAGPPGPLAPDSPVVAVEPDIYRDDFGAYTGTVPYPESVFAPYASQGERPESGPISTTPEVPPPAPPPAEGDAAPGTTLSRLGIDAEPLHRGGLLVTKVHADRPATRAGLAPGDVIRAVNGVALREPGDLDRTVRAAGAAGPVEMVVKTARGGDVRTVTTQLR